MLFRVSSFISITRTYQFSSTFRVSSKISVKSQPRVAYSVAYKEKARTVWIKKVPPKNNEFFFGGLYLFWFTLYKNYFRKKLISEVKTGRGQDKDSRFERLSSTLLVEIFAIEESLFCCSARTYFLVRGIFSKIYNNL